MFGLLFPKIQLIDFSDLLITGVREPTAFIMFILAISISLLIDYIFTITANVEDKIRASKNRWTKVFIPFVYTPKKNIGVTFVIISFLIIYLFVFVYAVAYKRADVIKSTNISTIEITTNEKTDSVIILGATFIFMIVFDPI